MPSDASERETVLTWTDADKGIAQVYTCQRRILTKLRKNPSAKRVEVFKDDQGHITGEQWEIPVKLISLRSGTPRRSRESYGTPKPPRSSRFSTQGRDSTVAP